MATASMQQAKPALVPPSFNENSGEVDFGGIHFSAERIDPLIDAAGIGPLVESYTVEESPGTLVFTETGPGGAPAKGGRGLTLKPVGMDEKGAPEGISIFDIHDFNSIELTRIGEFVKSLAQLQAKYVQEKHRKALEASTVRIFEDGQSVRKDQKLIVLSSPEVIAMLAELAHGFPHTVASVRLKEGNERKTVLKINQKDLATVVTRLETAHPELSGLAEKIKAAAPEASAEYGRLTGSGIHL